MEYLFVYVPWLHSISFSVYWVTKGHTEMGQMFTFVRVGWWNIVQEKMLHQIKGMVFNWKDHNFSRGGIECVWINLTGSCASGCFYFWVDVQFLNLRKSLKMTLLDFIPQIQKESNMLLHLNHRSIYWGYFKCGKIWNYGVNQNVQVIFKTNQWRTVPNQTEFIIFNTFNLALEACFWLIHIFGLVS